MSMEKVKQAAEKYQRGTTAPLGFFFKDLTTGTVISHRGDEVFPTASSYKIYILAELFRKAYAGECSLSDRIPLTDEIKSAGSGVLAQLEPGAELTLRDYAKLMMILSDNTATDVLFRFVGRENIRKNVIDALGLSRTRCDLSCGELVENYFGLNGRSFLQLRRDNGGHLPSYHNSKWYRCEVEENDETSPADAARMLELLYRGEWVSPEASAEMLAIMKACQTNTRIPKLLPPTTPVAHKTGSMDKLAVDIGIVYAPKGDYILCMFYNGPLADEADYDRNYLGWDGDRYLAELSGEIYRAYQED